MQVIEVGCAATAILNSGRRGWGHNLDLYQSALGGVSM